MIKLNTHDYYDLIYYLDYADRLYSHKILIPTNIKDDIANWLQGLDNQTAIFDFINYLKNKTQAHDNYYIFPDSVGSQVLYNIWDIITDMNFEDRRDHYLVLNLKLHELWLKVAHQSTPQMHRAYTLNVGNLTYTHMLHVYTRDVKYMTYERKYYWNNVKKYSWDHVRMTKDLKHVAYVTGQSNGKLKLRALPN